MEGIKVQSTAEYKKKTEVIIYDMHQNLSRQIKIPVVQIT